MVGDGREKEFFELVKNNLGIKFNLRLKFDNQKMWIKIINIKRFFLNNIVMEKDIDKAPEFRITKKNG